MTFDAKAAGKRIRQIRKRKGIPLAKAADALNVSESYYRKLETGERSPSLHVLIALSEQFDVSTDYILKAESRKSVHEEITEIIYKLQDLNEVICGNDHNQGRF